MADGDERRSTRTRGAHPVSYKEPGELKISQLEGKKDMVFEKPADGDSSDEEDFEQTSTRKGKGTAKKARRTSAASVGSPAPRKNNKAVVPSARHSIDGSESLFAVISFKPSAIPMVVKEWWSQFDKDQAVAVHRLTNMLLEACGMTERLSLSAFSDDDEEDVESYVSNLVEKCTSKNDSDWGGNSALEKKDKHSKRVQANFSDFWEKFVMHAPEAELRSLDQHPLVPWLQCLATAPVKVFRLVAATAGLELLVALAIKSAEVLESMTNVERLYEAACKKKDSKDMERQKEQLESKREFRKDAEVAINSFWNAIYMNRYKDTYEKVRAKCTNAVGRVIVDYPSTFLTNQYLKYVGWALFDRDHHTRIEALQAVDMLYQNKNFINSLEAFTHRFRFRVLEMSLDIHKDVQIRAIETSKTMCQQRLFDDEAGQDKVGDIFKLITEDDADIRRAAADFIKAVYVDIELEEDYNKDKKKNGKREIYMARGLAEMLDKNTEGLDDLHLVMDALSSAECDFLDDLDLLCDLMLEEDGEECLDEEQKATVGRMIQGYMATVSALDEKDESGHRMKKKNSPAHARCRDATLLLGDRLPSMVKHFAADVAALKPLIGCLEHFMLEAFNAKDSTLKDIAEVLVDITKKANDYSLLETCAIALEHFETEDFSAKSAVEALIKNLFKAMAGDLKKVAEAVEKNTKLTTVQELVLLRMVLMAGRCNVFKTEQSIRTHAVKMLEFVGRADTCMKPESASYALMLVDSYLSWYVCGSMDAPEKAIEAKEELMGCCKALFERGNQVPASLRVQAIISVADLHQVLGRNLTEEERPKDLEMCPGDIEDALPNLDTLLGNKPKNFEFSNVNGAVNMRLPDSEHDPDGSMRVVAAALAKPLCYGNLDEDTMIDALAVLTLQRPVPAPYNVEMDKVIYENVDQIVDDKVAFWHSAHARMCARISDEVRMGKQPKAVEMNQALVLSLGAVSATWEKEECYDYSLSMVEYVAENWDGPRAGFLDAWIGSGFMKDLDREQITQLLSNFDKLCQDHSIPIDTDEDEAEGTLPAILRFRKHLQGASTGIVVKGPGRPKGAATPGTKTKGGMPKAQLAFTPSGTPMSSQPSGASASSKSSAKRGSSSKRKGRQLDSDDEDADGWVAAAATSQSASSGGKKRR